jgi:redox-sensitive bicupin YhaK (pirin superfamily)
MKKVQTVLSNPRQHWVGDGFPVRTLFNYSDHAQALSPFLLLDFAGPMEFSATEQQRGVGEHPHRGFETVTIVYDGAVAHRDSTGKGGTIGPGDVQWMTAGGGILHEEFHAPEFGRSGGPFRMIQLWVNLPRKDKMAVPGYQSITASDIPVTALANDAGHVRVIAGQFGDARGPAHTFTPVNMWDLQLNAGGDAAFEVPEGHTAAFVIVSGKATVNGTAAEEGQAVLLERDGTSVRVTAGTSAKVLVLTGEPIDEPVVGYGPFVMNSEREIRQAMIDFNAGRFGRMPEREATV